MYSKTLSQNNSNSYEISKYPMSKVNKFLKKQKKLKPRVFRSLVRDSTQWVRMCAWSLSVLLD